MLDIRQAEERMTNSELYRKTGQIPISQTIKSRQFTGHCLRLEDKDEPANIYALYKSYIKSSNRRERPQMAYRDRVFKHLEHLIINKEKLTDEVTSLALKRSCGIVFSLLNSPPDDDDVRGKKEADRNIMIIIQRILDLRTKLLFNVFHLLALT